MSDDRAFTPPDVVAAGDVAEMLGVHRNSFARYHADRIPGAKRTSSGPVWERTVAKAYTLQHKTGRPYLDVLAMHRAGAAPVTIAVDITVTGRKISLTTVKRYLKQLGETTP